MNTKIDFKWPCNIESVVVIVVECACTLIETSLL